jgi:hypothetical protein
MRLPFLRKATALLLVITLIQPYGPPQAKATGMPTVQAHFTSQALSPEVVLAAGKLKPTLAAVREYHLWIAAKAALVLGGLFALHSHPTLLLAALLPSGPLGTDENLWPTHLPPYTAISYGEFIVTDKDLCAPIALTTISSKNTVIAIYDEPIHLGALANLNDNAHSLSQSVVTLLDALEKAGSDLSGLTIKLILDPRWQLIEQPQQQGRIYSLSEEIPVSEIIEHPSVTKAFQGELKRRHVQKKAQIEIEYADSGMYLAFDTTNGSISYFRRNQQGVSRDALLALANATFDSTQQDMAAFIGSTELLYQRPSPPHKIGTGVRPLLFGLPGPLHQSLQWIDAKLRFMFDIISALLVGAILLALKDLSQKKHVTVDGVFAPFIKQPYLSTWLTYLLGVVGLLWNMLLWVFGVIFFFDDPSKMLPLLAVAIPLTFFVHILILRPAFKWLVSNIEEPEKLLSLSEREIDFWNTHHSDLKIKAISTGFLSNWNLWFEEPRFLWAFGWLLPIPFLFVKLEAWTPFHQKLGSLQPSLASA